MKALVLLADGTEEMEAVIPVDLLRRARWEVTVASLKEGIVTASRGVKLAGDTTLDRVSGQAFDVLIVPGGVGGVKAMSADARVLDLVRAFDGAGKTIAAICAGPLVLQQAGILAGRRVTCHPGAASDLTAAARMDEPVVVDGHIVTSQGAGTCFEFALTLIAMKDGRARAEQVAQEIVLPSPSLPV